LSRTSGSVTSDLELEKRTRLSMTMVRNNRFRGFVFALIAGASLATMPLDARADGGFKSWIANFYQTAAQNGISRSAYEKAFAGVTAPDRDVLEKAAYQLEFKSQIWDYLDSRVNPYTVRIGREMLSKHGRTLAALERHFGVDKHVLLAIWSM